MVLSRGLSVAAEKSVALSPRPSGNFETEFCEEVPGAVGFTLLETLQHYVPHVIQNVTPKAGPDTGELVGLQLLIPRIFGAAAAQMAHSGYWGYFIGLSALKPSKRWPILGLGYFSEAALHALSKASGVEGRTFGGIGGSFVLCVFGGRDLTQPELCQIAAKFGHDNNFSKVTADCLIVEVPGYLKRPSFSCVLTSLNLPMLKLSPQQ